MTKNDEKCVTEILGTATKMRKLGGQNLVDFYVENALKLSYKHFFIPNFARGLYLRTQCGIAIGCARRAVHAGP